MDDNALRERLSDFARYRREQLTGDEKGEAQLFLERLFTALGHQGAREAGAVMEMRLKKRDSKGMAFADLMWKPRVLIEMKKAGADLSKHYRQAFDYWVLSVPDRPRYVVLCNFDEFWVYDFESQLDEPVDRIPNDELAARYEALAFMLPESREPLFNNDLVAVTRDAAAKVARVFRSLAERGVKRQDAQRFVLQSVMAMFSEDIGLLPRKVFTRALFDAKSGDDCYDLLGGLFREMNTLGTTAGGRYRGTQYFNGGLFADVLPLSLTDLEVELLRQASETDWSRVRPEIFGTLFEGSMDHGERHALGAHFTSQADIARIVGPCIVSPWRKRVDEATSIAELEALLIDMWGYRVLDPACGSGNFLYVAYREMRRLEHAVLEKISERRRSQGIAAQSALTYVTPDHFFGTDINPFAVEVAKMTLMLAKKLAADELDEDQSVLPLDNLDGSIVARDALFTEWPAADAIIGNPPYMGRRKMQEELGAAYTRRLAEAHPHVGGVSDFVTYWFPLAHDHLPSGGRAGFVATNTIRQNDSRTVSLDYVADNGGTIFEAVSSQAWSGDAAVHVSIVNWRKGEHDDPKVLWLNGNDLRLETDHISTALAPHVDVRRAKDIHANKRPPSCFQGQTPGVAEAFIVGEGTRAELVAVGEGAVVHPTLGGTEMLGDERIEKWIIDIPERDLTVARSKYPRAMEKLAASALPVRQSAAEKESLRNHEVSQDNPKARPNRHHANFLDVWWQLGYRRETMLARLKNLDRFIMTSRVASEKRMTVFDFVAGEVQPLDSAVAFPLDDDYSFGILSSSTHRIWLEIRCSTLETRLRYTPTTVWNTFPWPQTPTSPQVAQVANATVQVLGIRGELRKSGMSLRTMYDSLRSPGRSALRSAHNALDKAVLDAYGFEHGGDIATQLLALNQTIAEGAEDARGPGSAGLDGAYTSTYRWASEA